MNDTFETEVSGTPCRCLVTGYIPDVPAQTGGHPDMACPAEGGEFEFQLLDCQGNPAPWLEETLTEDDCSRLEQEFLQFRQQ